MGSRLTGWPAAASTALHNAGAIGGTPASPTPPSASPLLTIRPFWMVNSPWSAAVSPKIMPPSAPRGGGKILCWHVLRRAPSPMPELCSATLPSLTDLATRS